MIWLARPLKHFTKLNQPFQWEPYHQYSFDTLKEMLLTSPILFHPNYQLPFKIQTDTSGYGVGAILVQHQEGGERVISYVVGFWVQPS
jgi:hypothetical protein